jgi:hypothetical protein
MRRPPNPCVGESAISRRLHLRVQQHRALHDNPWQVSGYQFDMDSITSTGQLYEVRAQHHPGARHDGCFCRATADSAGQAPGDAKAAIKPHEG